MFAWHLWKTPPDGPEANTDAAPHTGKALSNGVTYTLVMLTGIWVGVLFALYALPSAVLFLQGFLSFDWVDGLFYRGGLEGLIVLVSLILFFFASLIFILFPAFIAFYYPRTWLDIRKSISVGSAKTTFFGASAATVLIMGAVNVVAAPILTMISFWPLMIARRPNGRQP